MSQDISIFERAKQAEASWGNSHKILPRLINKYHLQTGVEVGVAYGGHAEEILQKSRVKKLYGVDPFRHIPNSDDPVNVSDSEFELIFKFLKRRIKKFGNRYKHLRLFSNEASLKISEPIDFVYLDADHSQSGVWEELLEWFPKVREGGIIAGHDYNHPNFPGIKTSVDKYFAKYGLVVHHHSSSVWWVQKLLNISFIIPAFNCQDTVSQAVSSVFDGNFSSGDEVIIVDDHSVDQTFSVLLRLKKRFPNVQIIKNGVNKGGGAARNTAVKRAKNPLIFCLDSDNVLTPKSVPQLKRFLVEKAADICAFGEIHFFKERTGKINHRWVFPRSSYTLSDQLSKVKVPGASGNYLYTKTSWVKAGGYPENSGALDAWGFALRQLARGAKMITMPESRYYHRLSSHSYWIRDSKDGNISLKAWRILLPFQQKLNFKDVNYITSPAGRKNWFEQIEKHPIRLASGNEINFLGKILNRFI